MVETIEYQKQILAIIIRKSFDQPGVHFFTPAEFSQQLAYMKHPVGKTIEPHMHNIVSRNIELTQEVLIIRKGRLRIDFYTPTQSYLYSRVLEAGDLVLLAAGGHGLKVLEDLEMIEVKQGPYAGDADKVRIKGVLESTIQSEASL